MLLGKIQFPYVLLSSNLNLSSRCHEFALGGVETGLGVSTFRSESDLATIFESLCTVSTDFSLIQTEGVKYSGDRRFSRIFGHIT